MGALAKGANKVTGAMHGAQGGWLLGNVADQTARAAGFDDPGLRKYTTWAGGLGGTMAGSNRLMGFLKNQAGNALKSRSALPATTPIGPNGVPVSPSIKENVFGSLYKNLSGMSPAGGMSAVGPNSQGSLQDSINQHGQLGGRYNWLQQPGAKQIGLLAGVPVGAGLVNAGINNRMQSGLEDAVTTFSDEVANNPETRAKVSKALKGFMDSPEGNDVMSSAFSSSALANPLSSLAQSFGLQNSPMLQQMGPMGQWITLLGGLSLLGGLGSGNNMMSGMGGLAAIAPIIYAMMNQQQSQSPQGSSAIGWEDQGPADPSQVATPQSSAVGWEQPQIPQIPQVPASPAPGLPAGARPPLT